MLQRLADKSIFGSTSTLSIQEWDALVQQAINSGQGDYGVYDMIRKKVLGTTLSHDLQIDLSDSKDKAVKGTAQTMNLCPCQYSPNLTSV